jgi:hypothetical protein
MLLMSDIFAVERFERLSRLLTSAENRRPDDWKSDNSDNGFQPAVKTEFILTD